MENKDFLANCFSCSMNLAVGMNKTNPHLLIFLKNFNMVMLESLDVGSMPMLSKALEFTNKDCDLLADILCIL